MLHLRTLFMLSGLGATFSAQAALSIDPLLHYLPAGTSISVMVQSPNSSRTLVDYNGQQMMLPASTQKVVTALAATLELGRDYRFTTTFESDASVAQDTLQGNLTARFSGDPTLTRQQIQKLAAQLKSQGINRIQGNLVIDTSIFASHDRPSGWSWDNMTQCYGAPPSAAVIDKNCFSARLETGARPGDLVNVRVLGNAPVTITSEAHSYPARAPEARFCEFDVVARDNNQFTLTGCLTQQNNPITLTFAIQDSIAYAGQIIRDELHRAGITLNGRIEQQTIPMSPARVLATVQSEPLHRLLTVMLKRSDNIIADTLFRVLGQRYSDRPGTWRSGGLAIKQILRQKAGINLGNSVIADGSGLSRQNMISAQNMMQILQYIAQHDNQLRLIEMLPISSQDGTLLGRKSLKDAGLDGRVLAKTGALSGVYNLAGFIKTANGNQLAFVQFISGYSPEGTGNRRASLNDFETHLYRELYQIN